MYLEAECWGSSHSWEVPLLFQRLAPRSRAGTNSAVPCMRECDAHASKGALEPQTYIDYKSTDYRHDVL